MQGPECQGHTLKMLKLQDAAQGAEGAGVCERARLAWFSVGTEQPWCLAQACAKGCRLAGSPACTVLHTISLSSAHPDVDMDLHLMGIQHS